MGLLKILATLLVLVYQKDCFIACGMDRDNLVLKDWTKSFSSFLSVKFSFKVLWWVPGTGQGALQKDIQSC